MVHLIGLVVSFSVSPEMPTNPAELAEIRASEYIKDGMDVTDEDHRLLQELDHAAEQLGFTGEDYWVESGRAFIMPVSFEADEPQGFDNFFSLDFDGTFASYADVRIDYHINESEISKIRAICLAFSRAKLLPFLDDVPDDKLLLVPVLAVDSIAQSSV